MDSNRPKNVIEGFEEDLNLITKQYPERYPTLELPDFFKYWKSNKIDLIFANRFDPRELVESISQMYEVLTGILVNDHLLQESRITALYFIICLYAKQPTTFKQNIRLTLHDAVKVAELCSSFEEKFNSNAKFVWQYLRKVDAIDFVESRTVYGPSMLARRRGVLEPISKSAHSEPIKDCREESVEFVSTKINPVVDELEKIYQEYEELKEALKLEDIDEATVELESRGSFRDLMDKAKSLIRDYNAEESS